MENWNQENVNNYQIGHSINEMDAIGDYYTTVRVADYAHQEYPLYTPMDTSMVTETRLTDLNDECLERIFSPEFISIMDLCAVARTNHRLKNIANRQFSLNHKTCNIPSLVNRISDAKRVIITFGFLISDLSIGDNDDFNYGNWWIQWTVKDVTSLLIVVIKCCSESLDTLELDQCNIPEKLTSELKKLFSNLQKLRINDCVFEFPGDLFADCKKLVELWVYGVNLYDDTDDALNVRYIMDYVFPKLERFRYEGGDYENLAIFLSRHRNLKSLNILGCEDSFLLLPIIARNCNHLEGLAIDSAFLSGGAGIYGNAVASLQMLKHLLALRICCDRKNITEFIPQLNSLNSLEFLELCKVNADSEFTSALSQLKRLKLLELIDCRGLINLNRLADITQLTELTIRSDENISLDIVLLVQRLNSLQTLNIWAEKFKLDKKMYLDLVTVVRNRPIRSQQSLQIGCYIAEDAVEDLQNVRDNRQIVKLEIEGKEVEDVNL